ncbi:hypothetical protein OXPF_22220 [Oxobacter pfennigii]|uniref:Uncharacterized protein n=1 Tax=Oxobacter pfennigii TaxID=36849 RepID=A0A0N8NT76_9CLOT|nr:NusG domain II-containing protein [Oxobacter pfennigii]KPU44056.1 hypothetical protein OXPF_22220 [Oxobacter pfennigii]
MIKKGDKLLLILITAAVIIGYGVNLYIDRLNEGKEGIAIIEVDGKEYGRYDLKKMDNQTFELELPNGEHSVVEIKDGMIRIKEANCPDKVCVNTSWISKPGQIIVCLPYRVIIKMSGEGNEVDVSYWRGGGRI